MRPDDVATAVVLAMKNALAPVYERLTAIDAAIVNAGAAAELAIAREVTAVRERLAVVESREPVPGPQGADGPPGRDGEPGPPGVAGLRYLGVYEAGKAYGPGDIVTWAGGAWHCNDATDQKPGDGSPAWTLMVKRGRDGGRGA